MLQLLGRKSEIAEGGLVDNVPVLPQQMLAPAFYTLLFPQPRKRSLGLFGRQFIGFSDCGIAKGLEFVIIALSS